MFIYHTVHTYIHTYIHIFTTLKHTHTYACIYTFKHTCKHSPHHSHAHIHTKVIEHCTNTAAQTQQLVNKNTQPCFERLQAQGKGQLQQLNKGRIRLPAPAFQLLCESFLQKVHFKVLQNGRGQWQDQTLSPTC